VCSKLWEGFPLRSNRTVTTGRKRERASKRASERESEREEREGERKRERERERERLSGTILDSRFWF
jgi:hypothetical protein